MSATTEFDTQAVPDAPTEGAPVPRPRIRYGAIVWGAIVCGIATTVLVVASSPKSRAAFAEWLGGLTPVGYTLIGVLVLGGLILLGGLLGILRHAQRRD